MATWLEGCKRQDFGTSGGSWTRSPALIVLHSTETGNGGWPGYSSGQSAPHFTIDPRTGEKRQHISLAEAARALKNPSGGVETNRGGAVQIEIIGTCDPNRRGASGWTYLPDWTEWGALSGLLEQISEACGIPLTESLSWPAYPGSYGTGAKQRMSAGTWKSYRGVCGHMHVPENDHGDPGNVDIATILEGDDMPSATEVAEATLKLDGVIKAPSTTDTDANEYWSLASWTSRIGEHTEPENFWKQDGILKAPANYPTAADNPYWSPASFLQNTATWVYDLHTAFPSVMAGLEQLDHRLERLEHRPGHHRAGRDYTPHLIVLVVLALLAAAVSVTWQAAG